MKSNNWYNIDHVEDIASPGLVWYEERIRENIQRLLGMINEPRRLRPHVKTHKSEHITRMLLQAGIQKFKCATIAEAEMLGNCAAPDVLLAYQPVGPNISRYLALQQKFPQTRFSCLVDQASSAIALAAAGKKKGYMIRVYIDVNVGMDRTGCTLDDVATLYATLASRKGMELMGLHAYDGHIHDADFALRQQKSEVIIVRLQQLKEQLVAAFHQQVLIVAGGTPTFPIYSRQTDFECSPGTFIFWDQGYQAAFPEQAFLPAALLVTRIISLPGKNLICTDLGHKAVAAENSLDKRINFLNADLRPYSQSEEHLVLQAPADHRYQLGDVLYGLPYHICPTVALYERATVVSADQVLTSWPVSARTRKITI